MLRKHAEYHACVLSQRSVRREHEIIDAVILVGNVEPSTAGGFLVKADEALMVRLELNQLLR